MQYRSISRADPGQSSAVTYRTTVRASAGSREHRVILLATNNLRDEQSAEVVSLIGQTPIRLWCSEGDLKWTGK